MQIGCRCTVASIALGAIDSFLILNVQQSQDLEESFVKNQQMISGDLCPATVLTKHPYIWTISITTVILRPETENSKVAYGHHNDLYGQ